MATTKNGRLLLFCYLQGQNLILNMNDHGFVVSDSFNIITSSC